MAVEYYSMFLPFSLSFFKLYYVI
ncbi:unnamed protein product [Staphylococcus haemolyticus JCSC1435]|uniref:Uncharacterized protein n=1 Tax=Staphylococcus haemolyticus (strain JCSC1435) TaxID=279808 RepID=Q4L8I0_STAHJ|nr:unnamed protein product [Staphylococcus haemolyticus JCSC1435]